MAFKFSGRFCNGSVIFYAYHQTLVFQIPCEDRCLDPQTPPEVRSEKGIQTHTDPHKVMTGGFWVRLGRSITSIHQDL